MSRATALVLRGRRRAEALMVDTCEIVRHLEPGPLNPETGLRGDPPSEVMYQGRCKLQTYEPFESTPQSGQRMWTVQRYQLHIPVSVVAVEVGDIATITSTAIADDLLGRRYRISGLHNKTHTTARRLLVDEITG